MYAVSPRVLFLFHLDSQPLSRPLTSRRQLKLTLDFVVCLRHSNFTALGRTTHDTATGLFRMILTRLCEWPRVTQSQFAATLFIALSQENKPSSLKVLDQVKLWRIFTRAGTIDLYQAGEHYCGATRYFQRLTGISAGFSQYLLTLDAMLTSDFSRMIAEAWDCLRDVLLLIIRGRFFGEEEALAILVCPVICRALIHLLRQPHSHGMARSLGPYVTDDTIVDFILHSPWTATLLLELENVPDADAQTLDEQGRLLQTRLRSVAKSLIDAVRPHRDTD